MIGKLPILNKGGEQVATLRWKGTVWSGKGEWMWFKDKDTEKKILNAVKVNAELKGQNFSDMMSDARWVKGWQGFSGWYQALNLALPAFGMQIDDKNIVWPLKPIEGPEQDFDPERAQGTENGIS